MNRREASMATARSIILAMHARYEAAWEEYNQIDEQAFALRGEAVGNKLAILHLQDAQKAVSDETDLLRMAILRQVPSTFQEATVMHFHLWTLFDAQQNTADEHAAMDVAHDNLFDFMCGEGDNAALGVNFARGEKLARERRQRRSGAAEAWS
ncbi:MAG: hypothetical protein ABIO85_10075 [Sphingomicrobium sp.]